MRVVLALLVCSMASCAPQERPAVRLTRRGDEMSASALLLAEKSAPEQAMPKEARPTGGRPLHTRRALRIAVAAMLLLGAVCVRNSLVGPLVPLPPQDVVPWEQVLSKAARRAFGGGLSGALAGIVQVVTLMWLRTTMNYQYRHGTSTVTALRTLWAQGGLSRLYQGLSFALVQSPLSRFGDTAANTGVLALLASSPLTLGERTALASAAASAWRLAITPLDTLKTTLQVEGAAAHQQLVAKVPPAPASACTSMPRAAVWQRAGRNVIKRERAADWRRLGKRRFLEASRSAGDGCISRRGLQRAERISICTCRSEP
jgi:hypothetical protein